MALHRLREGQSEASEKISRSTHRIVSGPLSKRSLHIVPGLPWSFSQHGRDRGRVSCPTASHPDESRGRAACGGRDQIGLVSSSEFTFEKLGLADLPFLIEVRNECRDYLHDNREFSLSQCEQWF